MNKLKKLFGSINMSWKNTILFSIAVGIFCGIFGGMPILHDSSFTDMAGGYEFWTFTAVIICVNNKKFVDAGLKCGLYFLITQPLQFYLQAFLYTQNYANAFYYFKIWLPVIILTVPGGMIAYFTKKENTWGAIILGLGNTIEAVSLIAYGKRLLENPPYHLLSTLFSIASIIIMTCVLQSKKKNRRIAIGIPCALCLAVIIYAKINGLYL